MTWSNAVPSNTTFGLTDKVSPNIKFFYNNGILQWERCNNSDGLKNVYSHCAPVSSVIDNMADAFINGEIQALNARTENKVRGINKDWQKLIDTPNWLQDQSQFFKQLYTYRKVFGWCVVLKMKAVGFDKPSSLWVIPNWLLKVEHDKNATFTSKQPRKFTLCFNGKETPLDNEDLMLFTDVTNLYDEQTWLPLPRIYTKQYSLTLLISILEAETTLIQNKGAIGIISDGGSKIDGISTPMMPGQKEDLQEQWGKYGLTREKWQMIFTNANINYTPLVFDAAQLELKAGYLSAYKDVTDGLHYPFVLTAHSDQSTYNNVVSAEKSLYNNAILPDAKSIFKAFDKQLFKPEDNVTLWADYSKIDCLQENKKYKAEARRILNQALLTEWNNGLITRNMWLEALEEDIVERDEFKKYKWELTPEQLGIINTDINVTTSKDKGATT